jgi:effector-binding domain-containing protein
MKIAVLVVLVLAFVAWNVWGYFSSNVEQAQYTVAKNADGYEIRTYASQIVAQTTVEGEYEEALNEGFRIIAGYIFGGNTAKQKVAMTAPVTEQATSENVAMTAPVMAGLEKGPRTVAFVMPKEYTLDTLPIPNDSRVKLVPMPERTMAVVTFSWYRTTSRVEEMEKKLLELVERDGLTVVGSPIYAGYNAPWTPPWFVRNEVMVEVEQ